MGVLSDIGVNWSMPDINWASTFQTIMLWTIISAFVIGGLWWFIVWAKNKATYKYLVTLRTKRENGTMKENPNLLGGLVKGKNGIMDFKIKLGSFKTKMLGYIPNFSLASADNRLAFLQEGDGQIWQQCKETLITEKEIVDGEGKSLGSYNLLVEPIPTDVKTVTYNNLQNVRDLVDAKKLTAYGITIIGIIVLAVAHLISLYIQTKIKCGIPA